MKTFYRSILASASLAVCISVSAEDFTLQKGENVFSPKDRIVNATYVAQKDGKVLVQCTEVFGVTCDGKEYDMEYTPASAHGAYRYEVTTKKGDVVLVHTDFLWGIPTKIYVEEAETGLMGGDAVFPLVVENSAPTIGTEFTWSRAGQLTFNFNKAVTAKSVKFVANGVSYNVDEVNLGANVGMNIKNAIESATADGNLKKGDKFKIRMEGVYEIANPKNLYGGNGIFEAEYIAPAVQGVLVDAQINGEQIVPNVASYTLLSYYDAEGEDGVITFEFDRKVKSVNNAYLTMGNLDLSDAGQYYREEIKPVIDGNKVTIDLRGKLRSMARMFPTYDPETAESSEMHYFDAEHISLQLVHVLDETGEPFASPGSGSIGSYAYVFNYKEIQDNIVMDGDNCRENDIVENGQNITLWIDQKLKEIEGVKVTYYVIDESVEPDENGIPYYVVRTIDVPAEAITELPDPDGCVLSFNLPQMDGAANGQRVIATLSVKTMNGMPHDLSIKFWYGELPTGISAAETSVETIGNGIYDLSGRKVSVKAPGMYIINGKKYIKK